MSSTAPCDPAETGRRTGRLALRTALALATAVVLLMAAPLFAQAPAPGAAPAPAPTVVTRSLTLEWIIVVVMIGAVLFAVCRSSRRN